MNKKIMFLFYFLIINLYASNSTQTLKRMKKLRSGAKMTVIENPIYKKSNRLEISPYYGFSTNDPYVDTSFTGVAITYHLSEFWGIEMGYFTGNAEFTPLAHHLHKMHLDKGDISSRLESFYGANILLTPIYSKLSVLSNIVFHYDMYLTIGVGQTKTDWEQNFTYNYGVGLRLFPLRRVSFNAVVRDYVHREQRQSMTINKHNFFAMFSLSLFVL